MPTTSLQVFCEAVRAGWGPLSGALVESTRVRLETLLHTPPSEDWLNRLHQDEPARAELYRDPEHGFVLLAHTERAGLYRAPHDHGRSWVIYGVQQGEVEMGSYARVEDAAGKVTAVKRGSVVVRPGQALAYLPGDIHDTRCLTQSALLFRFTERDLKLEDAQGRVTRYIEQASTWTVAPQ